MDVKTMQHLYLYKLKLLWLLRDKYEMFFNLSFHAFIYIIYLNLFYYLFFEVSILPVTDIYIYTRFSPNNNIFITLLSSVTLLSSFSISEENIKS